MPIHAQVANRSTTVDPAKLLEIVRRWCPSAPVEVSISLVNALIEAAGSGSSGQLRLSLLEEFVLGLDAQLCSNSEKINRLKKETVRMAADPLRRPKLRPGHRAELARAALAAVQRAPDQLLSVEKVHRVLRRVKPNISLTSTYAVLKRMTDTGWLERDFAGVYGLPSRTRKPYEARTFQLFRLVYTAAGHEMGTAQARAELGWSSNLLSATVSELCSRDLLVKAGKEPRIKVLAEIVDKLERGEGVLIAPGKLFYARPVASLDSTVFTALRPERLPLEDAEVEAEIERLKALPRTEYEAQREPAASRLGVRLSVLDRLRSDGAKEEVGRAIPQRAAAVTAVPPLAVMSRAERKAIREASLKNAEERYFQLIEAQPDRAPEGRAVLEKKMMDDFKVMRDEARYCRAKAIKRYNSLHPDNPCEWGEPGR
jgi:hypothetical protein